MNKPPTYPLLAPRVTIPRGLAIEQSKARHPSSLPPLSGGVGVGYHKRGHYLIGLNQKAMIRSPRYRGIAQHIMHRTMYHWCRTFRGWKP